MKRKNFVCKFTFNAEDGKGEFSIKGDDSPRQIAIDVIKILGKAYNIDLTIMNEWEECEND